MCLDQETKSLSITSFQRLKIEKVTVKNRAGHSGQIEPNRNCIGVRRGREKMIYKGRKMVE